MIATSAATSAAATPQQYMYSATLRALGVVRKDLADAAVHIGAANVPKLRIPQAVAVGDQSAGKSALMQAISGIPFPQSVGTCTRCAIVVDMHPLEAPGATPSFVIDKEGGHADDRVVVEATGEGGAAAVAKAIASAQATLLANSKAAFSSKSLRIEANTHHKHRLVCVDLPGIVHLSGAHAAHHGGGGDGGQRDGGHGDGGQGDAVVVRSTS